MRPIIDGKVPNKQQLLEAYKIADMADGPAKEQAKTDWAKRHDFSRWPRVLFRGNPDVRDFVEKQDPDIDAIANPGRYLIESLS